ncbi:MAG TPA: MFS transporter [Pseudonocardiaceae bacterium]|nr:MFS transporter [Pseudonocardiaceae bacterium]
MAHSGAQTVHSGQRVWWVVGAAGLAIVAAGAFSTMAGLLVDPLTAEFGWSRGSIGLAASVNMVLNGVTAPFAAAWMDRFGVRRVVAAALAVLAVGAALTTVMTSAWQLTVLWGVLVGLGCGSLAMAFAAIIAGRWFMRRRGLVIGILTAASVVGQFVFLPVLSQIITAYHWRAAMLLLAAAALLVLPIAWLILRDHPADLGRTAYGATEFTPKPPARPHAASRAVRVLCHAARTKPFWVLAGMFAICGASTNGVMWTDFVPAATDHGMSATVAASLLTMVGAGNVVGTLASGWLTDRAGAWWLLAGYFALRGGSLILLPVLLGPSVDPSLVAFVVCFGLLDVATVPPTIALCQRFYGADSPIVFGWVNAAHQLGAGLVAFLGGVARDVSGSYTPVWLGAGALCVVAALLALLNRTAPTGRRTPPPAPGPVRPADASHSSVA